MDSADILYSVIVFLVNQLGITLLFYVLKKMNFHMKTIFHSCFSRDNQSHT